MPHSDQDILALDTELGDDGDLPGLAQPVTMDEIQDIIFAASDPVSLRVEKLQALRQEFVSRNAAATDDSFQPYIDEIDRGLSELQGEADGFIVPESLDEFDDPAGFDEDSAVDDPDPASTRVGSGKVSSPIDLDAAHTPDGDPTLNPASRID